MIDTEVPPEDDALFRALAALSPPVADPSLVEDFRRRARTRRRWQVAHLPLFTAIAAMLLLVASLGWWHEHRLRVREQVAVQAQLAIALGNVSASARLNAIAVAVRNGQGGNGVEQALTTALLSDQSANVRVAAADALGRIAPRTVLAPALQRALAVENSPFVQVAVLRAAMRLPPRDRRGVVQALLVRPSIDPDVRSEASSAAPPPRQGDSR